MMTETSRPARDGSRARTDALGDPDELAAIIDAYTRVTVELKRSHDELTGEVRRLSDQLDEKNRELARRERLAALGEMAAGVAHEIRNPLAGIQLFASLLERDLAQGRPTPGKGERAGRGKTGLELARRISAAVRTLDAVVSEILVFAGQSPPCAAPIAIGPILAEVVELLAPLMQSEGVTVRLDSDGRAGQLPAVLADPRQIQRALLNLARNAIEAAGRGGQVWVDAGCVQDDPERVRIAVADNGPGIPDELSQRIFNPFFTTRPNGTGLGLSIVHRIVEAHGGSIAVSRRDGGGAVFALTLPIAGVESRVPAPQRGDPAIGSGGIEIRNDGLMGHESWPISAS